MDFQLPPVGEGLYEVELVRWLVKPGDVVKPGSSLAELMSDKATMELPSPFHGVIAELLAEEGSKIKVGQLILTYASQAGSAKAEPSAAAAHRSEHAAEPPPAVVLKSERAAQSSVTTATVVAAAPPAAAPPVKLPSNGRTVPAAPSVRYLARKLGIDINRIRGSGPGGRVLLEDLTAYLKPANGNAAASVKSGGTDLSLLDFGKAGTRTKLAGLRRKIAERMVLSKRTIPHYSYVDEYDATELVRLRNSLREPLARSGVKLTYLAFFVKAVARALRDIPIVNSTFDEEAQEITLHDRYDIGVAVAGTAGLIVPVIREADRRDLFAIAREIERVSNDAKANRSKMDDLKGGTFTVTSVGGIGGLISTPIINHPEVGIMGVGKVVKRPVYDDRGNLRPADILYLSFSFDHRIVDGAVGAAFGNAVLKHLSNPAALLLPDAGT